MSIELTRLKNESAEYRGARNRLLQAEIELMRQTERVAELRRQLPAGVALDDYVFEEQGLDDGDASTVRLSELFSGPDRSLIVYHFMYGKRQSSPCPMCTMWIDGFNSVVGHVTQNVDFVIVAAAEPGELRAHARSRGWDRLRLLSAGSGTFKSDLGSEDRDGNQDSAISVITRDADGTPRHFYTAHPWLSEKINQRGIDLLTPVWNLLDLLPQGRGEWYPSLDYGTGT